MAKAEKNTETKTIVITETLKCILTSEEVLKAAKELAARTDELRRLEEEKKTVSDSFKSKITACETQRNMSSALVRDEYDWLRVDCNKVMNYAKNNVQVIRTDTGEVIENREMLADEKQREIEFSD